MLIARRETLAPVGISRPEDVVLSVEAAKDLIARCLEVRDFTTLIEARARVEAVQVYMRGRRASLDHQNAAAEMALRFERALGELLKDTVAPGNPKLNRRDGRQFERLDDLGITRDESSRWKKLASIPEERFDAHLQAVKAKGEKITTSGTIAATSDAAGYESNEWYTPPDRIELVRQALGHIDLDPASCATAQLTVQATRFFTREDDARTKPWEGRVFLNPPYEHPLVEQLVRKLLAEYAAGRVPAAVVLVNNATDTVWLQDLMQAASAVCFVRGRIAFLRPDGKAVTGTRQGQVFAYLGADPAAFSRAFAHTGLVMRAA